MKILVITITYSINSTRILLSVVIKQLKIIKLVRLGCI
jgi:hypothetical protein